MTKMGITQLGARPRGIIRLPDAKRVCSFHHRQRLSGIGEPETNRAPARLQAAGKRDV